MGDARLACVGVLSSNVTRRGDDVPKRSETELAATVVSWLIKRSWTVYQEVQAHAYDRIADIVAEKDGRAWVIECKTSFGWAVIEQAEGWIGTAHHVSVAVPVGSGPKWGRGAKVADYLMKMLGIGWLSVGSDVHEHLLPKDQEVSSLILRCCTEEHKTFARAGNANGHRLTPFSMTCRNVLAFVRQHPGCTAKELVAGVKTHYRDENSARACLVKWAGIGHLRGVELRVEERVARFYPTIEKR